MIGNEKPDSKIPEPPPEAPEKGRMNLRTRQEPAWLAGLNSPDGSTAQSDTVDKDGSCPPLR